MRRGSEAASRVGLGLSHSPQLYYIPLIEFCIVIDFLVYLMVFVLTFGMFGISSVCMFHNYGHTSIPIVIKFGINVVGIKAKRRICKVFYFPTVLKQRRFFSLFSFFFAVTGFERDLLYTELLADYQIVVGYRYVSYSILYFISISSEARVHCRYLVLLYQLCFFLLQFVHTVFD